MDDLSGAARDVLAKARRGAPRASDAVRARVQQRVESAAASATADPLSYARAGRHLFLAKVGVFSGVLLLGAAALRWSPAEQQTAVQRPAQVEAPRAEMGDANPGAQSGTMATEPNVARPAQDSAKPPRSSAADPSLTEELQLLDRAAQRLFEGDSASARRLLDAHRRRFRHPHLLQERHGLAVLADCTEAAPRAKASAMAFLRANPVSLLTARIERACGLGDGT